MDLLGTNTKLEKSTGPVMVTGLALAPSDMSGKNLCPNSTPGCRQACVGMFAGRTVMANVRDAMIRRAKLFLYDREVFKAKLVLELARKQRKAKKDNAKLHVRLNTFSDIVWEKVFPELFTMFSDVTFYDYTKNGNRKDLPKNYHLTYSFNETSKAKKVAGEWLASGRNVAAVFDTTYNPRSRDKSKVYGPLPDTFLGAPVVDGDADDIRTPDTDGVGVVVGLRLKGTNAARQVARDTGFAQPLTIGTT